MKKLFFLLFILIINTINIYSQPVTGIGKLKLGINISIINTFDYDIRRVYDITETFGSNNKIYEFVSDTNKLNQPTIYAKVDQRVRVFEVPKIRLNDLVEIKKVRLTFMNDTLVSIHCDYSAELNDALEIKYGKVETKIEETPHKFTKTYTGQEIILTDVSYVKDWSSKGVSCFSYLSKYYSNSIEPKYISYFVLENILCVKSIEEECLKYRERLNKRIEDKKKKSLEDF